MKQIKVLHVIYQMTTGGAQRVLVNLVNGSGPDFFHHIASAEPPDDFVKQITSPNCRVWSLEKGAGNDFSVALRIRKIMKENRIDVVHALGWGVYVESLLAAKILGTSRPFVFAFRGKTLDEANRVPMRRRLAQHLLSYFCDSILVPSQLMREEYARDVAVSPKRIEVIYNGVDLGCPVQSEAQQQESSATHFTFGCVARLDKVKGVDLLLHAFVRLSDRHPGLRLVVVGDGEERDALEAQASACNVADQVFFCGARSDIAHLLEAVDVYVQPSRYEGVSNAILEAMYLGKAIVATWVGGTPEIIEDGCDGLLTDPSVGGLEAAMERLLDAPELRKRLGCAARTRAQQQFSMSGMLRAYEELFNRLANGAVSRKDRKLCAE